MCAVLLQCAPAWASDPLGLMPEAASNEAVEIDRLTYLILWLTGITFVGVQALLVWFLFRYRSRPGAKAKYTHGNHTVELVWTVVPALILVFLALYQMKLWVHLKDAPDPAQGEPVDVQILAKTFEWNFRYPGPDAKFDTADALITVGVLVVPGDRPVVATMRSLDVIHSFFLPNLRVKWDALPGHDIPLWFRPTKLSGDRAPIVSSEGEAKTYDYWDIACAELCGNLHTAMAGKLYVVTGEQYRAWLADPSSVPGLPAWSKWNKEMPVTAADEVWARWSWQDDRLPKGPPLRNREPFAQDEPLGKPVDEEEDF